MKLLKSLLMASVALSLSLYTGCSNDDNGGGGTAPTDSQFDLLVDITDANLLDWTTGWIKDAQYVNDNLASLYVIDLRAAADYDEGHIAGAVNATPATLPTIAQNYGGQEIALVCYTGQTASWATMALRMLGYDNSFAMKFGMAAWNQDYAGSWDNNVSDAYAADFVNTTSPAMPSFDAPVLTGSETDGALILAERVLDVLDAGYTGLSATSVMTALDDYNVMNYWSEADYTGIGHIDGAFQVSPGSMFSDENLPVLDPDNPNVIYCWTGQTGSLMSFYLNVLGYETYNLKFGANSMIHSSLGGHSWAVGGIESFNFEVVTDQPVDEFALLSEYADANFADWTTGWIKDVDYTFDSLDELFVIDLRSANDFAAAHIDGAVNVTLTDMVSVVNTQNTENYEVAVVCYSGQTASFATMALRMYGIDAYAMKFGMSGWNDTYNGPWETHYGSDYMADMVNDASPALPENTFPVLETGATTAMDILYARVDAILAEGFGANTISGDLVFDAPGDYSVFNYWSQADYEDIGHIPGAFQLSPGSVTSDVSLSAMDPDGTNVVYCWTGQTSSLTTFYLNVMGYDALSLLYGANGMMYDNLPAHQWPAGGVGANYPVVSE